MKYSQSVASRFVRRSTTKYISPLLSLIESVQAFPQPGSGSDNPFGIDADQSIAPHRLMVRDDNGTLIKLISVAFETILLQLPPFSVQIVEAAARTSFIMDSV